MAITRRAALALPLAMPALNLRAQPVRIRMTRQPGIVYMAGHVMEQRQLIQKHAAALGLPGVQVEFVTFTGGGNATDALLSGNIEFVNTGVGNMLLLWDRTRGGVKGVAANCAIPLILVTRKPGINGLGDYGPTDKIAVPTVRVSTQAILLQIACADQFGENETHRLDANTVQLGHPDAFIALMNPTHEVTSHFSAPPFMFQALARVPGAHQVAHSADIMGGPLTNATIFTTTRYADANPMAVRAVRLANDEALEMIKGDTEAAVELYRTGAADRMPTPDVMEMLRQRGMMEYNAAPQGSMKFANHMFRTGGLKTQPKGWQDYFLPTSHDLTGAT